MHTHWIRKAPVGVASLEAGGGGERHSDWSGVVEVWFFDTLCNQESVMECERWLDTRAYQMCSRGGGSTVAHLDEVVVSNDTVDPSLVAVQWQ